MSELSKQQDAWTIPAKIKGAGKKVLVQNHHGWEIIYKEVILFCYDIQVKDHDLESCFD